MPIDLGLARVSKLLGHLKNPHMRYPSIHVAGTNGKGSTVAYVSSILTRSNVRNGRFTSPHMVCYNDCVSINNEAYPLPKFNLIQQMVKKHDAELQLNCTEFELLTITAFKIFEIEKVDIAVIEVGLGGRLDATNVLQSSYKDNVLQSSYKDNDLQSSYKDNDLQSSYKDNVLQSSYEDNVLQSSYKDNVLQSSYKDLNYNLMDSTIGSSFKGVIATGITKIGFDHESFLGTTIEDIAFQKAGIIKEHIPVVVDATNPSSVLEVVRKRANSLNASVIEVDGKQPEFSNLFNLTPLAGDYQRQNLSIALEIIKVVSKLFPTITSKTIEEGISSTNWPGRLQELNIKGHKVLLDGAHNESAAIALAKYLDTRYKGESGQSRRGIVFVIGLTKGKSARGLFKHILQKGDKVVFTGFSVPENMPWVSSTPVDALEVEAREFVDDVGGISGENVDTVLRGVFAHKEEVGDVRPVVVCGSLYLCADVLRGKYE